MRSTTEPAAFEPRPRLATTTPELDRAEQAWWDDNVDLVERVWAMPPEVREVVRAPMAARMRRFLGNGRILEVGCGSGWPGRLLASSDLRVLGVDFSGEQIRIAREEAVREGLAEWCEYVQGDMNDALDEDVDGVLIVAALHHLADDELVAALDRLADLPSGRRIFLYEPVFIAPHSLGRLGSLGQRAIQRWLSRSWPPEDGYELDATMTARLDAVIQEANRKAWFFSPKEVPFDEAVFLDALRTRFRVEKAYPLQFWAAEVGQRVALIADPAARRDAVDRYLRRAVRQDALLLRTGLYRLLSDRYVFNAYELTVLPAGAGGQ